MPHANEQPTAPAVFLGMQEGFGTIPPIALFNLTADVPGHPSGSTVSEKTLRALGFSVPRYA